MNQDCKMNGQKIGNGLNGVNGPHDARKHIDTNGVNGTTKIFDSPLTPENLPAIKGGFSYIADLPKWNEDKPYYISGPLPADQEHLRTNLEYAAHTPTLYNLRGHEKHLKMERDGFELVYYPPEVRLSLDANAEDRTSEYLEATTSWLEKRFEAEKVLCYAFRVRATVAASANAPTRSDRLHSTVRLVTKPNGRGQSMKLALESSPTTLPLVPTLVSLSTVPQRIVIEIIV